ncbi:hypothetical protein D3C73_876290 [compost metagenome]
MNNIEFKAGKTMLDVYNSTIDSCFTALRNLETNSKFGWGNSGAGIDTHMIKNSEWGAIAYLSKSSYGKDNVEITKNMTANNTGGGTGTDFYGIPSQSTTGTMHGVYDMSSIMGQYVAAYKSDGNISRGPSLSNSDVKYKDAYNSSTLYGTNSPKGDAMYEISSSTGTGYTWFGSALVAPDNSNSFIIRGGEYWNQMSPKKSGIFAMYNTYGGNERTTLRAIIAVDDSL